MVNPWEKACREFLRGCAGTRSLNKMQEECPECLAAFCNHLRELLKKQPEPLLGEELPPEPWPTINQAFPHIPGEEIPSNRKPEAKTVRGTDPRTGDRMYEATWLAGEEPKVSFVDTEEGKAAYERIVDGQGARLEEIAEAVEPGGKATVEELRAQGLTPPWEEEEEPNGETRKTYINKNFEAATKAIFDQANLVIGEHDALKANEDFLHRDASPEVDPAIDDMLDTLDAAIFTGDGFHNRTALNTLSMYLSRWGRESLSILDNIIENEKEQNNAG